MLIRIQRFLSSRTWSLKAFNKIGKALKNRKRLLEAQLKRGLSSARFIAVTGSSGKTSTVQLIAHLLSAEHQVQSQSFENGLHNAIALLRRLRRRDEFLVLEAGTAAQGSLDRTARIFRPDVAVVTLVAIEHYSAFRSLDAIAHEKAALVRSLPANGFAVLNYDDAEVRGMAADCAAPVKCFGRTGGDYRACDLETRPDGRLAFRIEYSDRALDLETQLIGEHNWLTVTAAAACALELGVKPETIAARIASFEPVRGRMSLHKVRQGPTFLLETVKAPFHSMLLPITTLSKMGYSRRRVVIGNISDYPGNPKPKYRDTYHAARSVADEVIFVGETARRVKPLPDDVALGRFFAFSSVKSASDYLIRTATPDEIILLKGAQNLHLERLAFAFEEEVHCWADACGKKVPCTKCGLYGRSFSEHGGKSKQRKKWFRFGRSRP